MAETKIKADDLNQEDERQAAKEEGGGR